jgi:hypothetical protein
MLAFTPRRRGAEEGAAAAVSSVAFLPLPHGRPNSHFFGAPAPLALLEPEPPMVDMAGLWGGKKEWALAE